MLLVSAAWLSVSSAQTLPPEKRQALAEQAALADAYRHLRARIADLAVDDTRTLHDWLASSASADIELRRSVTQAERVGRTRFYGNGDAEVDLRLPLKPVIESLRKLQAAERTNIPGKPIDLDALARRVTSDQIVVTGHGRAPTEEELTGPPGWPGGKDAGDLPPAGWGDVTPAGYKAAERAAELDALDHLVEQLGQLRMGRSRALGEAIAATPLLGKGLRQPFDGVRFTEPEYLPEQVCRIYVEVDIRAVVARLKHLRTQPSAKVDISEEDIDTIIRLATASTFRAIGYGVPPGSALRRVRFAPVDVDEPPWVGQSLRATGSAILPRLEVSNERAVEIAVQDARIAAQLKLAEQIDRLELPGGMTVAAFLARREALAGDVLRLLSAAQTVEGPTVDRLAQRVTLTLELPLRRLWLILRPLIPAIEVTTQPAPSSG